MAHQRPAVRAVTRRDPRRPSSSRTPVSRPRRVAGQAGSPPSPPAEPMDDATEAASVEPVEAVEPSRGRRGGRAGRAGRDHRSHRPWLEPGELDSSISGEPVRLEKATDVLGERRGLASLFDSTPRHHRPGRPGPGARVDRRRAVRPRRRSRRRRRALGVQAAGADHRRRRHRRRGGRGQGRRDDRGHVVRGLRRAGRRGDRADDRRVRQGVPADRGGHRGGLRGGQDRHPGPGRGPGRRARDPTEVAGAALPQPVRQQGRRRHHLHAVPRAGHRGAHRAAAGWCPALDTK